MRVAILPTKVILNILNLDSYITEANAVQISSPTFLLFITASRLTHPAELPLNSSCRNIT